MKSFQRLAPICLSLALACASATAQQIYRCGNNYSQSPCAGGHAIAADDPRTDEQRAAARQALAQDKELAKDMETSRRKDEALQLTLVKAAQAAQAHKAKDKKLADKKPKEAKMGKKSTGLRSVKVQAQEPGVFTAVADSGAPPKTKDKRSSP